MEESEINSLLHYSQLGRIELSRQPTDPGLESWLEQTIEVLRISQPQSLNEFSDVRLHAKWWIAIATQNQRGN